MSPNEASVILSQLNCLEKRRKRTLLRCVIAAVLSNYQWAQSLHHVLVGYCAIFFVCVTACVTGSVCRLTNKDKNE